MFVKKLLYSCAAFGLIASFSAHGEKMEATKQAPLQTVLPNAYGEASLGNFYQSQNSRWQAKAKVGSTFFSNRLDVSAVVGANKLNGTTVLEDRGTRLIAELEAYSNDYWTLMPYSQVWFQRDSDEGRKVLLGLSNDLSTDVELGVGTLVFGARHDFTMNFGTKTQMVQVTADGKVVQANEVSTMNQKRFGLVDSSGELKAAQSSPTLSQEVSGQMALALAKVPGVTLTMGAVYAQTLTPKMTWNKTKQQLETPRSTALNMPSYNTTDETWGQVGAKYDWTDSLYLACEGSVAAQTVDGTRPFKVRTSIGMDLF